MKYFADVRDVELIRYPILRDDGGGWHSEYVDLAADPCFHRYLRIEDETVVHNSHGTDVDDYHREFVIPPDEAFSLLKKADPFAARTLKQFEDSCGKAYQNCAALIREQLPGCEAEGILYNSENSTLIRVRNSDDTKSAVKICRMTEEDFESLRSFHASLKKAGGSSHIVNIEKLLRLEPGEAGKGLLSAFSKNLPGKRECLVLIKMPLLWPAYSRSMSAHGGWVKYKKEERTADSSFEFRSGLETAEALAVIHDLGYVHHDVRPENILVDEEGRFVLGDLESVRPLADQYEGHFQSSFQYRAPELKKHLPYGTDVDIFAWGKSMVYILSAAPAPGRKLEEVRANLDDRYHSLRLSQGRGLDGISVVLSPYGGRKVPLAQAAVKAQSENPAERWRNGRELVKALNDQS